MIKPSHKPNKMNRNKIPLISTESNDLETKVAESNAFESNVSEQLEYGIGLPKKMTSAALFSGHRTLFIEHAGSEYQLQLTNQNKLILTK
jgi:hemin uptake protein HemP